jgi:glycosyltransferase involved in cell wall biosynthesis
MPRPFISVIIPVWNSPSLIRECLEALEAQTYPRDAYEVLVVDNGSTDATPDVVREMPIASLLIEPSPGSYSARNLGISGARGTYVAFTDADCLPDPDWLEAGARAAQAHPSAAVLAGKIDLYRIGDGRTACENYERLFAFNQAVNVRNGVAVTANWMSPVETIVAAGSFNSALKSGGDYDLSSRLSRAGGKIVYVEDMRVRHPVRGSFSELASKTRRVTGGRLTSAGASVGMAGWFLRLGKDCLRRLNAIARSTLGVRAKLEVAIVALSLFTVSIGEVIRVLFGGETRRS